MSKTNAGILFFICFFLFMGTAGPVRADNADVLPKGVFSANIETTFYIPVTEEYNDYGDKEDIADNYNASLDANIFPTLSAVEAAFAMDPGTGTLGNSEVSMEYDVRTVNMLFAYGITDRLALGIMIPYSWKKTTIESNLDTTNATVGKTVTGLLGVSAPLAPFGTFGDEQPLTTEDILDLIGPGLDVDGNGTIDISGYNFERFKTWSDEGIGDIQAGLKYQYLKTDNWKLAFTGAVSIPTGKVDDPDILGDLSFGLGTYALLFRLHNDYTGIKDLTLNTTLKYDMFLPDKETLRVPTSPDRPITQNKEHVKRDLGDWYQIEISGKYNVLKGLNVSLLYSYLFGAKDSISGDAGYDYGSLEDESDPEDHVYVAGASYSTLPLYMEKKFPVPLNVYISYRDKFAGKNGWNSSYIKTGLQLYF